ncbi:hypothetical protein HD554DRAFT_1229101 [Boletus coccyginus]|nr:hypothetical protein HD554DRAFT_1229101 [Boletus coccyginus]
MDDPVAPSIIASSVLAGLVLLVFIFRIWIRIRMQRVGWEDIWATVAFVCGAVNVVSDWVYLIKLGQPLARMTLLWIYVFTFTCLVWAVRISIIFSIVRIIPNRERLHIYGLWIISFFLLACSALLVQKVVFCVNAYNNFHSIPSSPYFRCAPIRILGISELTVGFVADIVAIVFPLYVLRGVTLPQNHLRLLRLLFCSTIMVSITSCLLFGACRVVPAVAKWSVVVTNLQLAICLIVCNLLVVVTYLYRVLRCPKHRIADYMTEEDSTVENKNLASASSIPHRMTLTTIELLFSTTQSEERTSVGTGGTASVP